MCASRTLLAVAVAAALMGLLPRATVAEVTVVQSSQALLLDANTRLNNFPLAFTGVQGLANDRRPLYVRSLLQRFPVNPTQLGLPQARGRGVAQTVCFRASGTTAVGTSTRNFDPFGNATSGVLVPPGQGCNATGVLWDFLGKQVQRAGSSIQALGISERVLPDADPACFAVNTMCLQQQRFRVEVRWQDGSGHSGTGFAAPRSNDSGLFYFLDPDNTELLFKVLNGCRSNNHFWVFAAGATAVEFTVTVTDTERPLNPGTNPKRYFNPLGKPAAPIQDTQAFATCP